MTPTLPTKAAADGRPEDIPQDVWDAANAVADLIPSRGPASLVCVTDIARAILAERERCAAVEPNPAIELSGGLYGLAAIEAFWKGVAATKEALRKSIRAGA